MNINPSTPLRAAAHIIVSLLMLICATGGTDIYAAKKVACIGNSITFGVGTSPRETMSYPAQLGALLGADYEVAAFGLSGSTVLRRGHRPYLASEELRQAMAYAPDLAIIHLGVNDTDPRNWPNYGDEFVADYLALIDSLRSVNPEMRIILAQQTPIQAQHKRFKSGTRDWLKKIREATADVAAIAGTELMDFGPALCDYPNMMPDGVHPDNRGAARLARAAYGMISGDFGGLSLAPVYTSGMVVQRYRPVIVQGSADKGARVEVAMAGNSAAATAGVDGRWRVELPGLPEQTSLTMTVSDGKDTITLTDIAVGEVWLASGQSNMEFPMNMCDTYAADSAMCADPDLRLFRFKTIAPTSPRQWSAEVVERVDGLRYFDIEVWAPSTPSSVHNFSAVAWYFGKALRDSLQVPVGIIANPVGGSGIEAWIDMETLQAERPEVLVNWRTNDYVMPWSQRRAALNTGTEGYEHRHPYEPSYLYAAGIRPLEGLPLAGTIWYQGESNAHNTDVYAELFEILVNSWRRRFGQPEMPFIYAQLSSIERPSWPGFRNEQRLLSQRLPGVAMAVTHDCGNRTDVHPTAKKPVGERLARQALNRVYGMTNLVPEGPAPLSAVAEGQGSVILLMKNGTGMHGAGGGAIRGFELAEYPGYFFPAEVSVTADNCLKITNMDVSNPRYVRYAWQAFTEANLVNGEGLPASTFIIEVESKDLSEAGYECGVSAAYGGTVGGEVIVAGGCNFPVNPMAPDSKKKFYSGIYRLEPGRDGAFHYVPIGKLARAKAYGVSVSTSKGILLIGGTSAEGALAEVEMLSLVDGAPVLTAMPSLPTTYDNMAGAYCGGRVYIAGGNRNGEPCNDLLCLDLDNAEKGWHTLRAFPGNARVQPVLAASSADGKPALYLWGGFVGKSEKGDASVEVEGLKYNISKNRWETIDGPVDSRGTPFTLAGGTATTLPDGRILCTGGVNREVFRAALQNQSPDYLSHPIEWYGFNPRVAVFNPADATWTIAGTDKELARAGATAILAPGGDCVIHIGGELKPRIRTRRISCVNF